MININSDTLQVAAEETFAHRRTRTSTCAAKTGQPKMMMHPLDQLTCDEIAQAADIARTNIGGNVRTRFVCISLAEPTKAELAAFESGAGAPLRAAECVLLLPESGETREMIVDLAAGQVHSVKVLPAGTIAMFTPDDCFLAERIVKEDAGVRRLLDERYGITDMDEVVPAAPSCISAAV